MKTARQLPRHGIHWKNQRLYWFGRHGVVVMAEKAASVRGLSELGANCKPFTALSSDWDLSKSRFS